MFENVKAVFFDLDDTLYDRQDSQKQIVLLLQQRYPELLGTVEEDRLIKAFLDSDAEATRQFYSGMPLEFTRQNRGRMFLSSLGLDEDYAASLMASYLAFYPTVRAPVDGAEPVIRALAAHFQLGVISNGSPDIQYKKLDSLGVRSLFECVVLSEECGIKKPDQRIFSRAVSALGRQSSECLHVGDAFEADVTGAAEAGLAACWFNPGDMPRPNVDKLSFVEIRRLSELPPLLAVSA
jgi:putative hydrolase of the HAD superfamily